MVVNNLLQSIIAISEEAGRAIIKVYEGENLGITYKEDASPITLADRVANELIVDGLKQLERTMPVLSEESKEVPYQERRKWGSYFLVDPLDGTKEFIKRNGEFTVNIALIAQGDPILGVVHAPALGVTYYAARGEGAFRSRKDESPVKIETNEILGGPLKIVGSRSHVDPRMRLFLEKIKDYRCVNVGSSIKFCFVAEGSADLYPKFGPTQEWDTAAGQCVVEAAGGRVTDLEGAPLRYNKPDLMNPDFMVSGDPSFGWRQYLDDKVRRTTS